MVSESFHLLFIRARARLERPTLEELNEAAAPEVSGCNSPSRAEDFTLLFTRIQTRNTTALCDRNLFSCEIIPDIYRLPEA